MGRVFHLNLLLRRLLLLLLRIHKAYTRSVLYRAGTGRVRLPTYKYVGLNEYWGASHTVLLHSASLIVLPRMLIYKVRKGRGDGLVLFHLQHTVVYPCSPLVNCLLRRTCNWVREVFPVQQSILIFNNFPRCIPTSSLRTLSYERSVTASKAISPESKILCFILHLASFVIMLPK